MKTTVKATTSFATIFILFSIISFAAAQNYTLSYQLLDQPDGNVTYELNVMIPTYLHEHYVEKSHRLTSTNGFANFITPYALQPIAERLWEIYENDEDFANGVLTIVHQITYEETTPIKYPVEVMVDGKGDCDLFSFIAASIMKAGDLDVVLLYYEEQTHMNVGVHLSSTPEDVRFDVCHVTNEGKRYYVAECTGGNWREGWRVGECPEDLKQVSAQVLTLENSEQVAPGQVSASFTTMDTSMISLEVTPSILIQNSAITIHGQLDPEISNEKVTLYTRVNSSPWTVIGTAVTQSNGRFEYIWTVDTFGSYNIRAAWSGNDQFTGAISLTRSATVIPLLLTVLIGIIVIIGGIGAIAIFTAKPNQQERIEL